MSTKRIGIIFSVGVSLLILWTMLLPGYVLSLDLVFTPYFHYSPAIGDVLNGAPLWYFIQALYEFLPGWVVEKLMLFVLFFLISFISYTFLPVPKKPRVQIFASLLYTANTFVYVRMLAGQWALLFAYALLPLFIHLLIESISNSSFRREIQFGVVISLLGIFSLQLFVMAIVVIFVAWGYTKLRLFSNHEWRAYGRFFTHGGTALATVLVLTSYWTIPTLLHAPSFVHSFTAAHWEAFAAAGHGKIPVLLNLLMLGGFWGESHPWAQYFVWPQMQAAFWFAFSTVLLLALFGIRALWMHGRKTFAMSFVVLGIAALILATGDATSPFQSLNFFLYTHVPFWSGFRDSQKFIALLALSYAVLAGYGFDSLTNWMTRLRSDRMKSLIPTLTALLFVIPLTFGMYEWGGFAKQLPNVQFPPAWERARTEVIAYPQSKVLILPWQGYFSLAFDRNLIVANPASQYFGAQAVIGQNVRLDSVYDQATDPLYREFDQAIQYNGPNNRQSMATFLKARGISYVIYLQDLNGHDNFAYTFLSEPQFNKEWSSDDVVNYSIQ